MSAQSTTTVPATTDLDTIPENLLRDYPDLREDTDEPQRYRKVKKGKPDKQAKKRQGGEKVDE